MKLHTNAMAERGKCVRQVCYAHFVVIWHKNGGGLEILLIIPVCCKLLLIFSYIFCNL